MNLVDINGNEIIDFLNTLELDDSSIKNGSFVFEEQKIKDGVYCLEFTADFNNWGTNLPIYGNVLKIEENGEFYFWLEEPFDGDGTDDKLSEDLGPWLKSHQFKGNVDMKEEFFTIMDNCEILLSKASFEDKETIDKVIGLLTKARTYQK